MEYPKEGTHIWEKSILGRCESKWEWSKAGPVCVLGTGSLAMQLKQSRGGGEWQNEISAGWGVNSSCFRL